jgi:hypothetical protein
LVHDLVALRSGGISCIDGRQHLLPHLADEPRLGEFADTLTLLGAGCSTGVIKVSCAVEMMPKHPHLNV